MVMSLPSLPERPGLIILTKVSPYGEKRVVCTCFMLPAIANELSKMNARSKIILIEFPTPSAFACFALLPNDAETEKTSVRKNTKFLRTDVFIKSKFVLETCLDGFRFFFIAGLTEEGKHILFVSLNTRLVEGIDVE